MMTTTQADSTNICPLTKTAPNLARITPILLQEDKVILSNQVFMFLPLLFQILWG